MFFPRENTEEAKYSWRIPEMARFKQRYLCEENKREGMNRF